MSILSGVKKGRIKSPKFVLVHGTDGVGKTTFAAGAPNCIVVGNEKGADNLDVPKLHVDTWAKAMAALDELITAQHEYGTLAYDSIDWLEALLFADICATAGVENIEKYDGGYGKGYVEAQRRWRVEFLPRCEKLISLRGMNVILIAHSFVKSFEDPQLNAKYDRYQVKMNDKCAAVLREAVGTVLFLNHKTDTVTEKGKKKAKAFGDGSKVAYTEWRPAFDAKNRDSLPFEIEIPRAGGWKVFMEECEKGQPASLEAVTKEIENLLTFVNKQDELYSTVVGHIAKIKDDVSAMTEVRNHLREMTQQK